MIDRAVRLRRRLVRAALRRGGQRLLARRPPRRWWLVYGPARCGTSYMVMAIRENARLMVADWVLGPALQLPPELRQTRFDRARARRDTSRNILANARLGGGGPLDLAFKQAWMDDDEYRALVEMWGEPERKIFCYREPSGYMASAVKKFGTTLPVDVLQERYVESLAVYSAIGGDRFEYWDGLDKADYQSFLAPLVIPDTEDFDFRYSGTSADDLVTPAMKTAYADFQQTHGSAGRPRESENSVADARGNLKRWRDRGRHLVGRHPRKMPSRSTPMRRVAQAFNIGSRHECPICRSRLRSFASFGFPPRPDAVCPVCGSLEWHRLGWLEAERLVQDRRGRSRVLQVAPEPEIESRFRSIVGSDYVSVDLAFGRAGLSASIEELPFGSGSFDLVYCSHVLEHVTDDEAAMRELRRVVSDDGAAVILVPITADETWGDPSIVDEDERTRLFGQHDHVRVYGMDVVDRLERSGWEVTVVSVEDLGADPVRRFGLPSHEITRPAGDVFVCRPAEAPADG